MSRLSLETCLSNLKSVVLTVLGLLALTPQNLGGHMTLATALLKKIKGHIRTLPGNMHVKFEVPSFNNRFGAISI